MTIGVPEKGGGLKVNKMPIFPTAKQRHTSVLEAESRGAEELPAQPISPDSLSLHHPKVFKRDTVVVFPTWNASRTRL